MSVCMISFLQIGIEKLSIFLYLSHGQNLADSLIVALENVFLNSLL